MESKTALDKIIKKSRVHLYKPIQIAEILYKSRTSDLNLLDLESYRNSSKKWRDIVTQRLVGSYSTSSQKFQDNIFEVNAMPPTLISELDDYNKKNNGLVEAYIYKNLQHRLDQVYEVEKYIHDANTQTFDLVSLISLFTLKPGLKRSVDKVYEITVFALFSTIVRELKVQVTLEIGNKDKDLIADFSKFIQYVLGLDPGTDKVVKSAALYRVGVTNAADRGLDMFSNFGPIVQVKHLTLTEDLVEDISDGLNADGVVIVCMDAEKVLIESVLNQLGISSKIQGIITLADLKNWYDLCFSSKYSKTLGATLLSDLSREFTSEFPSSVEIKPFMKERGYDTISLNSDWLIKEI